MEIKKIEEMKAVKKDYKRRLRETKGKKDKQKNRPKKSLVL